MPLYEYECFLCKHRFERIRRVADASAVSCPECGGKVRRLLGAPALQFKGSGWYVTDYGKDNGSKSTALAKSDDSPPPSPKAESAPKKENPPDKADST